MDKLYPNWEIGGYTYPDYAFFSVDRRKLKKLKRKKYLVLMKNTVQITKYIFSSRGKIEVHCLYSISIKITKYHANILLRKCRHVNSKFINISFDSDERQLPSECFLLFNNEREYIKWKLVNE